MVHAPQRAAGSVEPALMRLLARLADLNATDSGQLPSDRLAGWLTWTDAIALARVLGGDAPAARGASAGEPADECARVRAALAEAIAGDAMLGRAAQPVRAVQAAGGNAAQADPAFEAYRERYVFLQRTMETRIGSLRGRLRAALAARGGGKARLAAVDAVMEQVLGGRERSLLGSIPWLLERRFKYLRRAAGASTASASAAAAWLHTFRKDARGVLLAELDLRFQPVEGLAEALLDR